MDASKTFRHQDYELLCRARAVDSGKFASALVNYQAVAARLRIEATGGSAYHPATLSS